MNVSRKQRDGLNSISCMVFGTTSKWQKLMNDRRFQIAYDDREEDVVPYVKLGKTIYRYENALAKGLIKPVKDVPKTMKRTLYRNPTPTEMLFMLEKVADENRRLAVINNPKLSQKEKMLPFVFNFVNYSVEYPWDKVSLTLEDSDKPEFEKLMSELPDQDIEEPLRLLMDNKGQDVEFPVVEFLKEVINGVTSFANLSYEYNGLMDEIDSKVFPIK